MKRIIYTIAALSFLMLFSCSDFLDKEPPADPSETSFWKKKSDMDMAMAACYATMTKPGYWYGFASGNWDNISDNGYCQFNEWQYGLTIDLVSGNIDPSSGGFIEQIYKSSYENIARVNRFIKQLDEYQNTDVSADQKDIYKGEALFFRAFYYSYLYKCYGDVPLVLEPVNLETQYQPKVEASKISEQISKDLDDAILLLPELTYVAAKGYLTKNAARIQKARMILYDGYDASGNAITAQMEAALKLLNEVKGYSLSDSYIDMFQGDAQEGNPEIIFSAKYLAPNLYHSSDIWYGSWIVTSPLTNLAEEYEFSDGTPFSASDPRYDENNPTHNRDPRMDETLSWGEYVFEGEKQSVGGNKFQTGYLLRKYLWREKAHIPNVENSYRSDHDWVQMRYADVLLMIAEAENEVRGANSVVYNAVNEVRTRVSVGLPVLPVGLNKDQMREKIRHERRIEFAFEGQRYFDLKRWKVIKNTMNNLVEPKLPAYKPKYEDRFYHWPLPQGEIDKNKGILVQNPDYK